MRFVSGQNELGIYLLGRPTCTSSFVFCLLEVCLLITLLLGSVSSVDVLVIAGACVFLVDSMMSFSFICSIMCCGCRRVLG